MAKEYQRLVDLGNDVSIRRSARIAAYKRAERFWALAELMAAEGRVSRHRLVSAVYGPTSGSVATEVEALIASNLLTYCKGPSEGREVWVSASSPRKRIAFAQLVADDAMVAYRTKAKVELANHERLQRMEQLALRREEQSDAAEGFEGMGQLLATAVPSGDGGAPEHDGVRAKLVRMLEVLTDEQRRTMAEIACVREEYDVAKWKGRWTGEGGK